MQIRRAAVDDAGLLARLNVPVQQTHAEARPDFFKQPAVTDELIADYRNRLSDERTFAFIGELDGEPVGYILAQLSVHAENPYAYATRVMHVDQMSVNPEQRGRGYGDTLMCHIFDLAKSMGINKVTLSVWTFNQRAISFYERHGFTARNVRMEAFLEKT